MSVVLDPLRMYDRGGNVSALVELQELCCSRLVQLAMSFWSNGYMMASTSDSLQCSHQMLCTTAYHNFTAPVFCILPLYQSDMEILSYFISFVPCQCTLVVTLLLYCADNSGRAHIWQHRHWSSLHCSSQGLQARPHNASFHVP